MLVVMTSFTEKAFEVRVDMQTGLVGFLSLLLGPIYRGEADVVLGSRFLGRARSMPWRRRMLLRGAIFFTWVVSGVRLTDAHNGLRAFSRRAAEMIDLQLTAPNHYPAT